MKKKFKSDYCVSPGEIIREHMECRDMRPSDLARACKCSPKHISEILGGDAPISVDFALKLEKALGMHATVWLNLEAAYRVHLARKK